MERPAAVLFDKDGTILPFAPFWTTWTRTFRTALDAHGALDGVPPEMLDWPANTRTASHGASLDVATMAMLRERVTAMLVGAGARPQDAARVVETSARTADAHAESLPVVAHDGFVEAVRGLRAQGIAVAIVTGDDQSRAVQQVKAIGLEEDITVVIGGDRGLPGKPSPETLLAGCGGLAVDPERCVYVGDSLVDVRAARAARFSGAFVYVPHDAEALPSWAAEGDDVLRDLAALSTRWATSPTGAG